MSDYTILASVVVAIVLLLTVAYFSPKRVTVGTNQRGIRFRHGQIVDEVGPGRYWQRSRGEKFVLSDMRRQQIVVSGQEILTSDHTPVKVSLIGEYSTADVTKAATVMESNYDALYARIQIAARNVISGKTLEEALGERLELGDAITERVRSSVDDFGLDVHEIQIRDFMLAGNVRTAFADVVIARQQGLAALEKARGETAAIRNLANSAQLMEKHPGIMQLRLLQAVESSSGNRVVIAMDPAQVRSLDAQNPSTD